MADTPRQTRKAALIAATRVEMEPTVKALGLRWRGDVAVGSFHGKPIHVLLTGMGKSRARAKGANLLKTERFDRVIHLGFAGGLNPQLTAGQALSVNRIIDGHGQAIEREQISQPVDFQTGGQTQEEEDSPTQAHSSDEGNSSAGHLLLTADQLAHTAREKTALHEKHHADAVDMESYHVARLALDAGLAYLPLRIISDPAELALPRSSVRWVNSDGSTNPRAVIGHMLRRPRDIRLIRNLGRVANQAAEELAQAVQRELE